MYLLPGLRGAGARWTLPQLRRRTGASAGPVARQADAPSGLDPASVRTRRVRPTMSLRVSRRGLVPPFIAMDVLRAANEREAAGADVIHLEVGQPGTPAPEPVLAAARRALASERIGYTDALGIPPLRQAIAAHYQAQYGVAVDPAEVVVTTGSSAAFQLAFLAAFEPGDRVGLAVPGYPAYRNIMTALGIEPVPIAVGENSHYQPTPELLPEAGPLAGLIIASPA